jgi:crotonobetainyl-CoA:carnitine CoA-transferase CaiB-like acyl-CoA transferase
MNSQAPITPSQGASAEPPLARLVVLEFAWTLPGPYCGELLAQLGADVIKVEPPVRGDSLRALMPGMFAAFNAGKRSIAVNLKHPDAGAVVTRLAQAADVVIEGFRPGVAERLGIGAGRLRGINPGLVYCSLSGFGQRGLWRDRSGHDVNYAATAGVFGAAARRGPEPAMTPLPIGDLAAGSIAAVTILAAHVRRLRTGLGETIDLSITDVLLSWSAAKAGEFLATGELPEVSEQQPPTHGLFRTGDGEYLALGAIEDHFWQALCRVVGRDDWLARPEFADNRGRAAGYAEIHDALSAILLTDSCNAWVERLTRSDVPASRVLTVPEAFQQDAFAERGMVALRPSGGRRIGLPALLDGVAVGRDEGVPDLGEHTELVLRQFACDDGQIEAWKASGVIV